MCMMGVAIGATLCAGIDAQGANAKSTETQDDGKKTVTISGCLQGPLPADEYSPSAGAASTPDITLRLTNVTMKPMPAGSATYLVIGSEKQLSAQLGHQVQIVGTTQPARAATAEPAVRVESVRMLSAKCSERQ